MTAAPDPWELDWPKEPLLTRLCWWLSDIAWDVRELGYRIRRMTSDWFRPESIAPINPPPLQAAPLPFDASAHLASADALTVQARESLITLTNYFRLAEPLFRTVAELGEPLHSAALASFLLNKASWLDGQQDEEGSRAAVLESMLILARLIETGFDEVLPFYVELQAVIDEPTRDQLTAAIRHTDTTLPRCEPEMLSAIRQSLEEAEHGRHVIN